MSRPDGWKRFVVLGMAVLAGTIPTACSDSPASLQGSDLRLELVYGNGQKGVTGLTLLEPIIVRVVDARGNPRSGMGVNFEILEGGGTLRSSFSLSRGLGLASTKWKLAGPVGSTQKMRAYLPDGEDPSSVVFEATALGTDQADVVIFRNALGPLRAVLLVGDDEAGVIEVVQEQFVTDTVVPLQPIDSGELDVLVFPQANPPQRTTIAWTEEIDTVYVELQPPFELPLRINVFAGPFEDRVEMIEEHLARAQRVWDEEGMGLIFSDVTFVDRTGGDTEIVVNIDGVCDQPMFGTEIKVDYVHMINADYVAGYACGNQIFMGARSTEFPTMLAHEMGHLFSLPHSASGLMKRGGWGSVTSIGILTVGEVFTAHFDRNSALNWLFEFQPQDVQRRCLPLLSTAPSPCLNVVYEILG